MQPVRVQELTTSPILGGLGVGDRVRLTDWSKSQTCRPGDTGRIVWVSRWNLYHVRMDRAGGPPVVSFLVGEIEPIDVC
jgi:hypothetical protein